MPPVNDDFANATVLSGVLGSSGDNPTMADATTEVGEPTGSNIVDGLFHTVWYQWEATGTGTLAVGQSSGSINDPDIDGQPSVAVWTGASLGALVEVGSGYEGVEVEVVEGTTYMIQMGTRGEPDVEENILGVDWELLGGGPTGPHGVCIAFGDVALSPDPTWTQLDSIEGVHVTGWSIDRGRSSELDRTEAGTANIAIIDEVGALDPTNTGGPFYGQLDPMKQAAITLQNPVTEEWTTLFRGFTSELLFDVDTSGKFANVTLELVDAFAPFASLEMMPGQHGDVPDEAGDFGDIYLQGTPSNRLGEPDVFKHVDDRINDLLDDANWPVELRDIFSGNVSVQGKVYERRDQLLAALMDAADAEFPDVANIYVSKTGVVTFHGRFARFFPDRPGYGINTWRAGGVPQAWADAGVVPVAGVPALRRSDADVINVAVATPQGIKDADVPGQLSKDDTSIALYGWRAISWSDLQTSAGHNDDASPTDELEETKKFADYRVGNYAQPKTRVSRISFRALDPSHPNAAASWALICGVEISDIIPLDTTHAGGGGFDEDFYVEGIHYDVKPLPEEGGHDVTLELDVSPRSFFDVNPFGDGEEIES
jgi:hypothetical protein